MNYTWKNPLGTVVGSSSTLTISSIKLNESGKYIVTGIEASGCSDTASQQITVNQLPLVSLGVTEPICSGAEHRLTPGPGYASYLWKDGSTDSVIIAKAKGYYWVKATDNNGCSAMDTAELVPCSNVYIPNAFSPNSNGMNETFRPICGDLDLLDFSMIIFDRWGKELFETVNYQAGWDGTSKGKPVETGVYSYYISYKVDDPLKPVPAEPTIQRGIVTLVR
jgi:gliding motility-associated-like protein